MPKDRFESDALHSTVKLPAKGYECLVGGGEMGELMRALDWSQTSLGPVEQWSQSLRSALSICLNSRFPIAIYWGAEYSLLYNDAWRPIVGDKHPWALGRPGSEVWSEIWDVIGPEFASVLKTGEGIFHSDELLSMHRFGYTEECYFEYTFNPIQGESGKVDGVLNIVSETTYRVLGDRRARLLREVASQTGTARTPEEACALMAEMLRSDPADIPFALIYLVEPDGKSVCLYGSTQSDVDPAIAPAAVDLTERADAWFITPVVRSGQAQVISDLTARFGTIPGSAWQEPPEEAVVLPLAGTGQGKVCGVLVAVASPRRRLDDHYRDFLNQVAGQIGTAIANARAYEEERQRAEQLAELDRAKTLFFSNVSHEFRTPLTLMLAPTEDALSDPDEPLTANQRERIETVQRNGLRLLKLVNTLLDFSRLEAGRVEASYEPTDLAAFTAELASVFRSAIERAGMRLVIDCSPLPEPVYIDREMWEKIVFNLLSNAFKFTFEGEIRVRLFESSEFSVLSSELNSKFSTQNSKLNSQNSKFVILTVEDTGIGIPAAELPHLFERFHRVKGAQGRSFEGSGIGLSLVQELVKLHGGTIGVTSVEGSGTCFTISIPTGTAHLPQERISVDRTLASTALNSTSYLEEALRWLPGTETKTEAKRTETKSETANKAALMDRPAPSPIDSLPGLPIPLSLHPANLDARILLADDNADMRDYVRRLLSQRYEVKAVSDGVEALAAIRQQPPDLVLTDVMMPNLDGFGLLQALRADPQTREIPIILLSARAGEEARIEGLEAGADDYLLKPFSARELLARVEASLKLAQLRREAAQTLERSEERYRAFVQQSSEGIWRFEIEQPIGIDRPEEEQLEHFYQHAYLAECNQMFAQMYGVAAPEDLIGSRLTDFFVPTDSRNLEYLRAFIRAGYRLTDAESYEVDRQGNRRIFLNNLTGIIEEGKLVRAWGTQRDITDRKRIEAERQQAEAALRDRENLLSGIVGSITDALLVFDKNWRFTFVNEEFLRRTGLPLSGILGKNVWDLFSQAVGNGAYSQLHRAMAERTSVEYEIFYPPFQRWFLDKAYPTPDGGLALYSRDITDRKQAELERERLLEAEQRARFAAEAAREEAQAANRIKDEFLAVLSHELRSPLNPILGWAKLLQTAKLDTAKTAQALATIERNAKLQSELIEDLLDVSRILQGKLSLNVSPLDLAATIRSAIETVRLAAEAKSIIVVATLDTEVGRVSGDATRLQQVVWNLLSNAIKFTPAGGRVEVRLEQVGTGESGVGNGQWGIGNRKELHDSPTHSPTDPPPHASSPQGEALRRNPLTPSFPHSPLPTPHSPTHTQITVTDTGKGIHPDFLPYVFDYFRQEDGATTRKFGGLGLGLAIVKHLVELHGGTVNAESPGEGLGATFTVRLPLMPIQPVLHSDRPSAERSLNLNGVRVLVVDDEMDSREFVSFVLEQAGATVTTAPTAGEGFLAFTQSLPDVLLSDIGMPDMDGYMLMQQIRLLPPEQGGQIPSIALTAYAGEINHQQAMAVGYQRHLSKPVEPEKLVQTIVELLQGR